MNSTKTPIKSYFFILSAWVHDKSVLPVDVEKVEEGQVICDNPSIERDLQEESLGFSMETGYQVQFMLSAQSGTHKLIRLSSAARQNRPCVYCKLYNKKTATGLNIRTYFKCDVCNVSLCLLCFQKYHNMLMTPKDLHH